MYNCFVDFRKPSIKCSMKACGQSLTVCSITEIEENAEGIVTKIRTFDGDKSGA